MEKQIEVTRAQVAKDRRKEPGCDNCGNTTLIREGRCYTCPACGYSRCG